MNFLWQESFMIFITTALLFLQVISHIESFKNEEIGRVIGSCDKLLDEFAATTASFTYCAIRNARPITFCENCVDHYIAVLESHKKIFEETDETGEPCKLKLLNLDRLVIVEAIFKTVPELWGRGECDYCFEKTANGTLTNNERNATLEFKRRHIVAKECINEHWNDTVCDLCHKPYQMLNNYYNEIKIKASEKDNDNICMDIVDLMNATRTQWSRVLNCIPLKQSQMPLFVSGSILLVTPAVFYMLSMCLSHRERDTQQNNPSGKAITVHLSREAQSIEVCRYTAHSYRLCPACQKRYNSFAGTTSIYRVIAQK